MWNTLFWRWISSKNLQKGKNVLQKNFLSGLVTKLENLFVFGKNLWKISSNGWFQKKLLTNLTSAQTLKVCSIYPSYYQFVFFFQVSLPPKLIKRYILMRSCSCLPFPNKTRNISLLPLWTVSAQQASLPVPVRPIPKQEQEPLSAPGPGCLCQAGASFWSGGSVQTHDPSVNPASLWNHFPWFCLAILLSHHLGCFVALCIF